MPKTIFNADIEQGRYGFEAILDAVATIPEGFVIGGMVTVSPGTFAVADYAGEGVKTGDLTALDSVPAGLYIPGRFSAITAQGGLGLICYFEPLAP